MSKIDDVLAKLNLLEENLEDVQITLEDMTIRMDLKPKVMVSHPLSHIVDILFKLKLVGPLKYYRAKRVIRNESK